MRNTLLMLIALHCSTALAAEKATPPLPPAPPAPPAPPMAPMDESAPMSDAGALAIEALEGLIAAPPQRA